MPRRTAPEPVARAPKAQASEAGPPSRPVDFESDARPILDSLSRALARVVEALPQRIQTARQLQHALDLDYALAWQTHRLATAVDAIAAGASTPTPAPMERFLSSALRRGVDRARIQAARDAYAVFERLVQSHAPDRSAFDSLIGGVREEAGASLDLKHRRAAYRANAHLWGFQVDVRVQCSIFVPGDRDIAHASVAGWVGLSASRPNAVMTLPVPASMCKRNIADRRAVAMVDPASRIASVELLEDFSSSDLPPFLSSPQPDGSMEGTLRFPGVGRGAAVSFHLLATAPHTTNDGLAGVGSLMRGPCEVLHSDLLVAEGCSEPSSSQLSVYARVNDVHKTLERRPEDRVPMKAAITHVASISDAPTTPDVPRYPELVQHVIERMGWSGMRFDLYRARLEYPVLHTFVDLSVRLKNP